MHIRQLDGLRGIAILLVLLSHTMFYPVFSFFRLGSIGVDIFFTLSGFLITGNLLKERETFVGIQGGAKWKVFYFFYARRFLRIFPLYYLVLLVCYAFNFFPIREVSFWLISFTCNWLIAFQDEYLFQQYSHFWSLAVEEQFYVFFPFLIVLPKRREHIRFLLLTMIAIGLLSRLVFVLTLPETGVQASYYSTPSSLDALCLGGLLAMYKQTVHRWVNAQRHITLMLIVVAVAIVFFGSNVRLTDFSAGLVFGRLTTALLTCIIIFGISNESLPMVMNAILSARPLVYIGKISYGIYILHPLLNKIFIEQIQALLPSILSPFLVLMALIFSVSALSFEFFEKRVLTLKRFFYLERN
jgi:peptidoglycan/LPS O-acetylase OafA/YrhL